MELHEQTTLEEHTPSAPVGLFDTLSTHLEYFLQEHPNFTAQLVMALITQETTMDDLYK